MCNSLKINASIHELISRYKNCYMVSISYVTLAFLVHGRFSVMGCSHNIDSCCSRAREGAALYTNW